jgi:hypothetical protein
MGINKWREKEFGDSGVSSREYHRQGWGGYVDRIAPTAGARDDR